MTAFWNMAAQYNCVNENSGRSRRRRTIQALFLMLPVFCMIAATPGLACLHETSLAAVDDALSKHTLSRTDHDKAMELRAKLAELVAREDDRAATAVEAQIMDIMGLKLEPARGGCGYWVPKSK
jgi:hypothetical protein